VPPVAFELVWAQMFRERGRKFQATEGRPQYKNPDAPDFIDSTLALLKSRPSPGRASEEASVHSD
jgi:hypothetical protein